MTPVTLRILIVLFLIAHGLMHYSLTTVPLPKPGELRTPFWPAWWRPAADPRWPVSRLGLPESTVCLLGSALWLSATVAFALAGLGLLISPSLPALHTIWQGLVVFASIASLAILALYWHPWLVMGAVLSLGTLVAIGLHWPAWLYA